MTEFCTPAPENKQKYIADIGNILLQDFGEKEFYKPQEVENAHQKSKWHEAADYSCWAMSIFSSHDDFDHHHEITGEVCSYLEMRSAVLEEISTDYTFKFLDAPAADLEVSWLDFSALFEGLGDFLSIFDF